MEIQKQIICQLSNNELSQDINDYLKKQGYQLMDNNIKFKLSGNVIYLGQIKNI